MASIDADALWDLSTALKGLARPETAGSTEQAMVTRKDADGTVWVRLTGAEADTPVNGERLADVTSGDSVTVTIADGTLSIVGNATRPSTNAQHVEEVVAPVAEGVEVARVDASAAKAAATSAEQVANATAQHVWTDTNGLHVTEATREDWETNQSGANTLLNSLGQLFRDGLNNLLAIVSGTSPAVEIYDGQGNASSNIVARFASDLIKLGDENAEIELCGDKGVIKYDSDKALPFQILGEENVLIGTSSIGSCYVSIVDSSSHHDISLYADEISLDGSTLSIWARSLGTAHDYDMADLVNAIPVTLYDNASASASASATLSESAANFKRLTIFFRDSDNNFSSVDVWSPNGKRVALSLTWINGAATQDMYQRVRWVTINGTTISTSQLSSGEKYRTGQVKLNGGTSVTNSDYIAITHVIGYR